MQITHFPSSSISRRSFISSGVLFGTSVVLSGLSGCAQSPFNGANESTTTQGDTAVTTLESGQSTLGAVNNVKNKALVVFFSRAGQNYTTHGYVDRGIGNTEVMAGYISDALGCDVFKIEPSVAYPTDYEATLPIAQDEQDSDARPAIDNLTDLPNLDAYDTLLVGSGIWWGKPPMIMRTFLESIDTKGKTIVPFTTEAGSGLGSAIVDYANSCPDAKISGSGLSVSGEHIESEGDQVRKWAKNL